ncbi:Uncharacterized protein QTN25_007989 [Entamoeba marina]
MSDSSLHLPYTKQKIGEMFDGLDVSDFNQTTGRKLSVKSETKPPIIIQHPQKKPPLVVVTAKAFRYENGNAISQGNVGVAVIDEENVYSVLLYRGQNLIITKATIHAKFSFVIPFSLIVLQCITSLSSQPSIISTSIEQSNDIITEEKCNVTYSECHIDSTILFEKQITQVIDKHSSFGSILYSIPLNITTTALIVGKPSSFGLLENTNPLVYYVINSISPIKSTSIEQQSKPTNDDIDQNLKIDPILINNETPKEKEVELIHSNELPINETTTPIEDDKEINNIKEEIKENDSEQIPKNDLLEPKECDDDGDGVKENENTTENKEKETKSTNGIETIQHCINDIQNELHELSSKFNSKETCDVISSIVNMKTEIEKKNNTIQELQERVNTENNQIKNLEQQIELLQTQLENEQKKNIELENQQKQQQTTLNIHDLIQQLQNEHENEINIDELFENILTTTDKHLKIIMQNVYANIITGIDDDSDIDFIINVIKTVIKDTTLNELIQLKDIIKQQKPTTSPNLQRIIQFLLTYEN